LAFVREAQYLGVPAIAVVDSSVSYLEQIAYPIMATSSFQSKFLERLFRLALGFRFGFRF